MDLVKKIIYIYIFFCLHLLRSKLKPNLFFLISNLLDAKTYIIQNLQYYDFLSDSMAELLQLLVEQYENSQLVEDVLMYL
jgi:hypothetical protein